jgi:geranylgeranyl pyrophosphate synthase
MMPIDTPNPLRCDAPVLTQAVDYVLANPGKQIRAQLAQASYGLFQREISSGITTVATAIEWLHTYSLVHDDLPAMDDDDLRRGQPTVHKVFDEATAILVGDGLQAAAFANIVADDSLSAVQRVELIKLLTHAVGFSGMVGGQALDIAGERQRLSLDALQQIHHLKTGALITAATVAGGICAGASEQDLAQLKTFGKHLGLAFQVTDDILDVTQSSEQLGKTAGKDLSSEKSTYVSCLGLDGARAEANALLGHALAAIAHYEERAEPLRAIADQVVKRLH